MAYRGQGQKVQKVMVQPINLIFRYLQNRSRIQVWLYEQVNMRIEGCIIGFDEYMNLVLDDAEEIHSKTKSRKQLAGGTVFLCVVYYTNRNKFGEQGKLGVWGTVTLCHLSESPEKDELKTMLRVSAKVRNKGPTTFERRDVVQKGCRSRLNRAQILTLDETEKNPVYCWPL
uniref:Small nuclear ribonucleoprotein E n=1 Tax=Lynx canadensis TaxID=61383 RepID=A0A667HQI6_LYNCA